MPLAWILERLEELARDGLLRDSAGAPREEPPTRNLNWVDAASNDYLGLGRRCVSRETLEGLRGSAIGAGASRLVHGTFKEHRELEQELARWCGVEGALLTGSAFAANLGAIPALTDEKSLVVSDALNHASIVDGCRLARARVVITPHLELGAIEQALRERPPRGAVWVVTEALFSMDGDCPDLKELRAVCDRYEAGLILDEAHSLGVFGERGGGLAAQAAVTTELLVGGLGKAVGSQGGFVASDTRTRELLWNRSRSFVFSTATSPLHAALTLLQLRDVQAADDARLRLGEQAAALRTELARKGFPVVRGSIGPIVPVLLGSNERALGAMRALLAQGIVTQAIRPPTVPAGSARLRLTVHADWPEGTAARIASALEQACGS